MNKTVLLILLAVGTLLSNAQENAAPLKHRVMVEYAISSPQKNFSKADAERVLDYGYAEVGNQLSISYEYRIRTNLWITSKYSLSHYDLNTKKYTQYLNKGRASNSTTIQSEGYTINSFLIGAKKALGRKKLRGFINPLLGVGRMVYGKYSYYSIDPNNGSEKSFEENTLDKSNLSFMYGINVGVNWRIYDKLDLELNLGTVRSSFSLNGDLYDGNFQKITSGLYPRQYSVLNTGVSIGYYF